MLKVEEESSECAAGEGRPSSHTSLQGLCSLIFATQETGSRVASPRHFHRFPQEIRLFSSEEGGLKQNETGFGPRGPEKTGLERVCLN
jgi:hypothetical protein